LANIQYFILTIVFILIGIVTVNPSIETSLGQLTSLHLVSTRNNFNLNTGDLISGKSSTGYTTSSAIPGLQNGINCPKEIAIYVHGVWVGPNSLETTSQIFDRASKSIASNNYSIPIIGFSWDSDTPISIDGTGWLAAKLIAEQNGPKLAQFISNYKNKCNATEIRLIAHSMGARVVLSSLESLYYNQGWNSKNFKIKSVHLMGAAVDNEEVAKSASYIISQPSLLANLKEWYDASGIKSSYGNAIEKEVGKLYNLYNPNDKSLGSPQFYSFYEQDIPLGLRGSQPGIPLALNYKETDVRNEIPFNIDANGDNKCDIVTAFGTCMINGVGDNHFGYVGFRNANGILLDDGAMNVVVKDWKNNP